MKGFTILHFINLVLVQWILPWHGRNLVTAEPVFGKNVVKVRKNEFLSVVSIYGRIGGTTGYKYHICGGALISSKHVLTAAHCILSKEIMESLDILIGSNKLKSPEIRGFKATSWLKYHEWEGRRVDSDPAYDDIAVIKLNKDVIGIEPANVALEKKEIQEETTVTLAGWGHTSGVNETPIEPLIMRKVSLKVTSKVTCSKRVRYLRPCMKVDLINRDSSICLTAEPYALGGPGDSGSPLFDGKNQIIGMHSWVCPKVKVDPDLKVNVALNVGFYGDFIIYAKNHLS